MRPVLAVCGPLAQVRSTRLAHGRLWPRRVSLLLFVLFCILSKSGSRKPQLNLLWGLTLGNNPCESCECDVNEIFKFWAKKIVLTLYLLTFHGVASGRDIRVCVKIPRPPPGKGKCTGFLLVSLSINLTKGSLNKTQTAF